MKGCIAQGEIGQIQICPKRGPVVREAVLHRFWPRTSNRSRPGSGCTEHAIYTTVGMKWNPLEADGRQVGAAQNMQITIIRKGVEAFGGSKLHNQRKFRREASELQTVEMWCQRDREVQERV